MRPSEKFKLCPHCDGRAPLEVVICPFCAQNFHETPKTKSALAATYTPPYSTDRVTPTQQITPPQEASPQPQTLLQEKSAFLPIALLTIGCNLVALSLLLIIFNHEGKVEDRKSVV